ncbi:flavin reductase family protein [Amycolatopsis sp. K13G38]|uniref:Flavin reductase family protein n=1 Tax=Amycolatopsis acididurans TaxID=2724524 RepID=A0ABX1J5H1_9PSEU|nr:flavin reductase family protein [Amycolatopsis acididurans]NKQ53570.1 flavin reductase family protein [Amycolatopsis acididurans]
MKHIPIEPAILYFGTPVVLISTRNENGSANLAPMSSAFWLGWRGMLGLSARSKTTQNLLRTKECVLNLPSDALVPAVDRLALTTGVDPVPPVKAERGYRYEPDKFGISGFTPLAAETVSPPRVEECPVHLECAVAGVHEVAGDDEAQRGRILAIEVRVRRVHVHEDIRMPGTENRIDPDRWRPLIMSFQRFYGLGPEVHPSRLASIPEHLYAGPDLERARRARYAGAEP